MPIKKSNQAQGCRSRWGRWGRGALAPPFLLDQLTLSQPAYHITMCPTRIFIPSYGPEASQGPPRRWAKNLGRRKK
jgi:hypothetical protein